MKSIRLALYFIVGLLLGVSAVLVRAETIPASAGEFDVAATSWTNNYGMTQHNKPTPGEACSAWAVGYAGPGYVGVATKTTAINYACLGTKSGGSNINATIYPYGTYCPAGTVYNGSLQKCTGGYMCPANQGWTLQGTTCTRPDQTPCPVYSGGDDQPLTQPAGCQCPSGTAWFAGGGCRKKCGADQPTGGNANAGFELAIPKGSTSACFQGCEVQHKAGPYEVLKDGSRLAGATWAQWACAGTGVGSGNTPNGAPEPDTQSVDETKKKPPKCGPGEGVITSSSGGVLCLPEGTPNTSTPKVETTKKVETFDDGTTKTTTETKTTDPTTGASSTVTQTVVTPKEDGTDGEAGKAGTSGTKSDGTGKDGDGDGDGDGECDPTLHFCGGPATDKLYTKKEKTMQSVFNEFKSTVSGSGVGQATTSFFNVSPPGGSCPNWSVQVPYLNVSLSGADIFCGGAILAALQAAGAVMLALATYIAFTWAFL